MKDEIGRQLSFALAFHWRVYARVKEKKRLEEEARKKKAKGKKKKKKGGHSSTMAKPQSSSFNLRQTFGKVASSSSNVNTASPTTKTVGEKLKKSVV